MRRLTAGRSTRCHPAGPISSYHSPIAVLENDKYPNSLFDLVRVLPLLTYAGARGQCWAASAASAAAGPAAASAAAGTAAGATAAAAAGAAATHAPTAASTTTTASATTTDLASPAGAAAPTAGAAAAAASAATATGTTTPATSDGFATTQRAMNLEEQTRTENALHDTCFLFSFLFFFFGSRVARNKDQAEQILVRYEHVRKN